MERNWEDRQTDGKQKAEEATEPSFLFRFVHVEPIIW